MSAPERLSPIQWDLGPFHALLSGVYRLRLSLDGEVIERAEVETGFTTRGVEQILTRQSWRGAIPFLDRIDPDGAVFFEWAYCLAVEQLSALELPRRAHGIRVILGELSRISSHLLSLAKVAKAAGAESAFHLLIRERERVLDLLELLCGARHALGFLLPGGVREDVTEGFLERVQEVCQQILQRIKEYNDLVTYNEAFVRRLSGRGVITKEMVARHRMTGIPARVFDREQDLRWSSSRLGYFGLKPEALESIEAITFPGDVHHRFVIRLHEVSQSAQILQVLSQKLAAGPFLAKGSAQLIVPEGEAEAEVETARGRLAVRVGSQAGRPGPAEIQFSPPSRALFDAVPQYLVGAPLQDLSLLLQSIDLLATEVDR